MKNIKILSLTACLVLMLSLLIFNSCSNDNENNSESSGPPVVESVMRSGYDKNGNLFPTTPVTLGDPKNYYIIHGSGLLSTKKVYFNDYDTYFRPTFVTDTDIIILIDENTPYADVSNKLKVVTDKGTTEFDFMVAPPVPTLNWFNSENAAEGDIVTVDGKYFLNPVVKVGTQQAIVVSSTLTEVKFKMPANSVNKYVTVSNISGDAVSTVAVGSALFDDVMQGDAGHWGWNSTDTFIDNFTGDKAQGTTCMKLIFGGWGGADMKFNSRDVSMYKAFRVKIKSISENKNASLNFVFGGWAYTISRTITSTWTTLIIPFSDIGNPTTFDQLTLQESGNFGGNTILMDDMGFILK